MSCGSEEMGVSNVRRGRLSGCGSGSREYFEER